MKPISDYLGTVPAKYWILGSLFILALIPATSTAALTALLLMPAAAAAVVLAAWLFGR